MSSVQELLEEAIKSILAKDFQSAKDYLSKIDPAILTEERTDALKRVGELTKNLPKLKEKLPRQSVRNADVNATFQRDHFTCRYKHCQRKTIYIPVLRELSRIFPDIFAYHKNWKFEKSHIIYWIYSTSLEHKISFPYGGNSKTDNLITACYLCNDTKNHYPFEALGWEINEPIISEWDGLKRYLPQLKMVPQYSHVNILDSGFKINETNNIINIESELDLNTLPVGTIAINIKTKNGYVILMKTQDELTYFSDSEKFALKIRTKRLSIEVEFKPDLEYSFVTSIEEIPVEIYTDEQNEFIKKALNYWKK